MSRSGYTDDCDDNLAAGRWRAAVKSATHGKRGQALLRELLAALDAMPDKRLYRGSFAKADGEGCTLGVLGAQRGTKMDDLGDDEDGCDTAQVGARFGIARALAAEIMYLNDEGLVDTWHWQDVVICGPMRRWESHIRSVRVDDQTHQQRRWQRMRDWVASQLKHADQHAPDATKEGV